MFTKGFAWSGVALAIAIGSPATSHAQAITIDCNTTSIGETIANGYTDITIKGNCSESLDIGDIVLRGDPGDGTDTITGQVAFNAGANGAVLNLTIANSGGHGILAVDNATVFVEGVTIDGAAGNGVHIENGALVRMNQSTVQNSAGTGVQLVGAQANIAGSTIRDNQGGGAISAFRHSNLSLHGSTLSGSAEGLSVNEHSEASLGENTISNSDPAEGALVVIRGSALQLTGGDGNTVTSPGYAIFASNDASLLERDASKLSGIVLLDLGSIAEFRNVTIAGKVQVADHSTMRMRDQSSSVNHVSIRGNVLVSLDSGLNFVKDSGEQRVKVAGNITCADNESSLGASSSALSVNGKVSCTGY